MFRISSGADTFRSDLDSLNGFARTLSAKKDEDIREGFVLIPGRKSLFFTRDTQIWPGLPYCTNTFREILKLQFSHHMLFLANLFQ